MASFFISYRVKGGKAYAVRLLDWLVERFGAEAIFLDQESMSGGEHWSDRIKHELERAVAVLVIVDQQWSQSFAEPRETQDFLKLELETAIDLKKTIIPLLVGDMRKMPARSEIPSSLYAILDCQCVVVNDTSLEDYATSVNRLITRLGGLDGVVIPAIEEEVPALLTRRQYAEAERVLLRQPEMMRASASFSVYLALARLRGRSFNSLHPNERGQIEALVRNARAADPSSPLPAILLAILKIDYYDLHGLVSAEPMPAAAVLAALDGRTRSLLTGMRLSRRALQELQLDSQSEATA
ncbi:MAG TPA: toll/interleukin-1 receptor domain-containing protein [Thermoanaerobaculia bacterium]|jgi:hypothetical protein|nr:toll/interleukin-1 receptor domain-containing protein [Thermoanaerobaculia bacterium]